MYPALFCLRRIVRFIPGHAALFLLLLWAPLLAASAMAQTPEEQQSAAGPETVVGRLPVVASFSILGDMVREVGGEHIELSVIVGPLNDAHTFEPTPRDARALGGARLLVVNGLNFESWMPRLIEASGFQGQTVVASQGVRALPAEQGAHDHTEAEEGDAAGHSHDHGPLDPHAWQDLSNGVIYVQNIAQGLAQADPAHASAYFARADAYVRKLHRADSKWRRALAAIPPSHRVIASSHQAFAYFAAAYDLKILSVVGPSSEAEPSAHAMADLVRQVRSRHIAALFPEQGGNARALQRIADETGVQLGGVLYADTLDRPGHQASSYLGMFQWNTQQLLKALTAGRSEAEGTPVPEE